MEFAPDGPKAIPMWINGHAFLTVTDAFFTVTNPATGEAIHRVPLCGASLGDDGHAGPASLPGQSGRCA